MVHERRRRGPSRSLGLAVVGILAAGPAAASALALSVTGAVEPPISAFDPVPAGAVLRLAPDAEVTLLHEAACVEQTIRGGVVVVGADGLRVGRASTITATLKGACPVELALDGEASTLSAVVLRAVDGAPTDGAAVGVAPRPRIAAPALADSGVAWLVLAKDGVIELVMPFEGAVAAAPEDAPALPQGGGYALAAAPSSEARPVAGGPLDAALRPLAEVVVSPAVGLTLISGR